MPKIPLDKPNTTKKVRATKKKLGILKHAKNAERLRKLTKKGVLTVQPNGVWKRYPLLSAERVLMQVIEDVTKKGSVRGRIAIGFDVQQLGRKSPELNFGLVFYPKKEHIENFLHAQKNLRKVGPSEKFPGAVGSIRGVLRTTPPFPRLKIFDIQALFKVGGKKNISHGLASKYWGWRKELLRVLFEFVEKEGIKQISYADENSFEIDHRSSAINNRQREFIRMAVENGFEVSQRVYENYKNENSPFSGVEIIATKTV